jgi:hypothetical protein
MIKIFIPPKSLQHPFKPIILPYELIQNGI